jgi:nucleotide-binding universal stress UspA family protein
LIAQGIDGAYYVPPDYVDSLLSILRDTGTKLLHKAEAAAAKQGQAVTTAIIENLGATVAYAILRHARKVHADLIVMGTHGRRGLKRVVMGSDAEAVLRESRVPVLLVRVEAQPTPRVVNRNRTSRSSARTTTDVVRTSPTP